MNTTVTTNDKKNYVSLLIADFISSFGSSMTALAIMLEIFRDTESLFVSAVFSALTIIPKIIITFAMPKINIHMKYRSLFAVGEITCAGLLGTILINKSVAYICVIYSIFGIMFFILECYRSEFLKVISTEETIYKYQSVSRAVNVIVNVVAPLVAGILLSYASIDMVIVVDMITYILAALIILRIDGSLFTLKQEISKKRSISLKFLWGGEFIYI